MVLIRMSIYNVMRTIIFTSLFFFLALLPLSSESSADVVIPDMIAVRGKPLMLMAETKDLIFRKGGQIVEFFVDEKSIGKTLSGGDGVAYMEFTPTRRKLYAITAQSGEDTGKGLLLSLKKGESIVFVDVEGGLMENPFSMKPREGSRKTIEEISKRYPVVFVLARMFGKSAVRDWLRENDFKKVPLFPLREGMILKEIQKKGLKIKAVVGGQAVIEPAKKYKAKVFSFDKIKGAEKVKNWKELNKKLR